MKRYQCSICGYIFDPQKGEPGQNVPAGTDFEKLEKFVCPICGAPKNSFYPLDDEE